MEALRATRLIRRFASTLAVDEVSLTVAAGEVRGLLGPNGAGKTTLLRMLFGLVRPDDGAVELLGRELDHVGGEPLAAVGGFVEEPAFYPYLSGRANLELLARLDGLAVDAEEVTATLSTVDLLRAGPERVGGYSTGMRQRLGIAAALIRRPRLLLLDEPTSALDPAGARAIATLIRELAGTGVAVLLSSHQIGALERVCDSYTVMRAGRAVWDGTVAELEAAAPASTYALATSDDGRALRLAASRSGLEARVAERGGLVLAAGDHELDQFVLALGEARVAVRRLELLVSPLEAMFYALTQT